MINRMISRGIDVAISKMDGRMIPDGVASTTGIRETKNRTNMVGQKAMEKLAPMIKDPDLPLPIFTGIRPRIRSRNFKLKAPAKNNPTKMIK